MTFEGEHRQIPLRGIERSAADGIAQDGGMEEVINLIPRNGSYVPYEPTSVAMDDVINESGMGEVKMVRVHHTNTGDNTIVVCENCYYINPRRRPRTGGSGYVITGKHNGVSIKNIVFIGNRMDLETTDGIKHLLWKNDEYVNIDDLCIHSNNIFSLPYFHFRVDRGIYDGSTVYPSARYIKTHKAFTDADTAYCSQNELSKYVLEGEGVGSDAAVLLDSIRHMGGITGYVLVTAAWRVKGSDASHPKYLMAAPILLMGAPENYMKEGQYIWNNPNYGPDKPKGTFFLDMFDYQCERSSDINDSHFDGQTAAFDKLWNMSDSDGRESKDLVAGEHMFIEPLSTNDKTIIRISTGREERSVTAGTSDNAIYRFSATYGIKQTALCGRKYALYSHGSRNGTYHADAEYRAVHITHGTANYLSFQMASAFPEQYKDEVDRLCIFISPIISPYKTNDVTGVRFESDFKGQRIDKFDGFFFSNVENAAEWGVNRSGCGGSFSPVMKSNQEIIDEIKNIAGLYKVAEYQIDEITANEWRPVNLSGGKLSTERMVQNSDLMLKISDIQSVGFSDGHIFGYNERLHVFNYKKDEVYRFRYASQLYFAGAGQYPVLELDEKEMRIEVTDSHDSRVGYSLGNIAYALNPLISCPDIDTKEIRVAYRRANTSLGSYYAKEQIFTPLEIGGLFCGYISNDLKPIGNFYLTEEVTESTYNSYFRDNDIQQDSYSHGYNELRVSNPASTVFEVDKSYKIGHGTIIALARLGVGLSQDNRGKFPLIVFCTDGIYTLSVDASGKYAYSTQDPLSRAVCTNVNGICEVDGAVLFPTEFGLQMVTDGGVKPVVLQANGWPKNCPEDYMVNGLLEYKNAIEHEQLVQLYDKACVSSEDFRGYIQDSDTHISYLHALNSVIVYNRWYNYSYLIELGSWIVTKSSAVVLFDNNNYPKQEFICPPAADGNGDCTFVRFDYDSGNRNTQVLLATRPIALGSRHLKMTYRDVIRGTFEFSSSNPRIDANSHCMGMYVYGSLDGEHWDFLNGTEKPMAKNRFHDIGVETHHVSYKYMMVVLVGEISKDSHIDGLEITSKEKYNNKLK